MLLDVRDLDVRYGRVQAVRGVSVHINAGEIVTVLGANGAGKSSLLRALLGIERIAAGSINFDGTELTHLSPSRRVQAGLVLVPEGRRIVKSLTVHETLLMGAFNRRDSEDVRRDIDALYSRFPKLAARRDRPAWILSVGEQQMLALGRALLARPKLVRYLPTSPSSIGHAVLLCCWSNRTPIVLWRWPIAHTSSNWAGWCVQEHRKKFWPASA